MSRGGGLRLHQLRRREGLKRLHQGESSDWDESAMYKKL